MPNPRRDTKISDRDRSKDHRCETIRKKIEIPGTHHCPKPVRVSKSICCDDVDCKGCKRRVHNETARFKNKNVKLWIKEGDHKNDSEKIDVIIKRGKAKCFKPKIEVDVTKPHLKQVRKQRIDVFVEKGKNEHKKPKVRVHCEKQACHLVEPDVKVKVDKNCKVECFEPEVQVHFVKRKSKSSCSSSSSSEDSHHRKKKRDHHKKRRSSSSSSCSDDHHKKKRDHHKKCGGGGH